MRLESHASSATTLALPPCRIAGQGLDPPWAGRDPAGVIDLQRNRDKLVHNGYRLVRLPPDQLQIRNSLMESLLRQRNAGLHGRRYRHPVPNRIRRPSRRQATAAACAFVFRLPARQRRMRNSLMESPLLWQEPGLRDHVARSMCFTIESA